MTAATFLTLANGKFVDLLDLKVEDVDFKVIAEHLGKEKRFNGATPGEEYSVAQHCVIGTEAMLKEGATEAEAAYFLLHDAHEAIWKDDPTPKKRAIAERIQERCGILAADILDVLDDIPDAMDAAIHQAAGLCWPMPVETARLVKFFDVRMFVTEWRDLMGGGFHPDWDRYAGVPPLDQPIVKPCWSGPLAMIHWHALAHKLLPSLRRKVAKP